MENTNTNQKVSTSNWIALIVAGVAAVAMMIAEGIQGHHTAIFALSMVCFAWASVFYGCQFFVAKRRYAGILIGAILEGLAAIAMLVLYILFSLGVL